MPSAKEVLSLTDLKAPLLTAYVKTDPVNRPNGKSMPAYIAWLKREAKPLANGLPELEREKFYKQLSRAEQFLTDRRPKEKGIVIFASPATWTLLPLQIEVENELHWGKPALSQLLSLVDEEEPALIVVIDRAGARFFRYALGEMSEYAETKFDIDSSQWKKKVHSHMAPQSTEMPHGNQRDVFKQRMDAQYLHACREVAKRTVALAKQAGYGSVFLVGSKRLTKPVEAVLPQSLRRNVTFVEEDLARAPIRTLQKHIGASIASRTMEEAARRVDQLLQSTRGVVMGLDETLAELQEGRISTLVVARGFDQNIRQCTKCGLVNASADPVCPNCSSKRRTMKLSDVLPELLRLHKTTMEVVNGEAGARLLAAGGMGGRVRKAVAKG